MEIGTVTGSVWATRKARELGGHTLLVVRTGTGKTASSGWRRSCWRQGWIK